MAVRGLHTFEEVVPLAVPATAADRPLGAVHHLGSDDRSTPRVRIVDAALRLIAVQGIRKTTLDDLAREAGMSRATLYRAFPGGKDAILDAVAETEAARLFSEIAVVMGEAHDLSDVLVAGIGVAARSLATHRALRFLLEHEPEVILPHLAFAEMDHILFTASSFVAPFFGRWLEPDQAARAAEWATRILLSYLASPNTDFDLTDPDKARRLVRTFVMPGIQALRSAELDQAVRKTKRTAPAATRKGEATR